MAKISIALAAYNGERYIREQLDSFVSQTRMPDELVVCDDCSSDATVAIVSQFAHEAPFPVKVVTYENNIGYIENFSNALALCTGDIVLPSDQDDVWLPHKIATLERYFADHPDIQLIIHDIAYCKNDLTPIGQTKIQRMRGIFDLYISYVVGMASAIRGDFLRRCLPIPLCGKMTHDKWLHLCADAVSAKAVMEDVLALYRRHDANVTSESLLNVDFITSTGHFKQPRLRLVEKISRMRDDMLRLGAESSALLEWLVRNRNDFVEMRIAEAGKLDGKIERLQRLHEAETLRGVVLTGSRKASLGCMIKLYRSGGYAFFRGWKSLAGDALFRCVFRL